MFVHVCFALGVLTALIAAVRVYFTRYDAKKCSATILLGVLAATFWLILPVIELSGGESSVADGLYRVLVAFFYSFKSLGGGQDVALTNGIVLSGALKYAYIFLCYFMFFLAPIVSSTLIVSCFGDMGERIRYCLKFSKRCYVFSDLNGNSLAIAEGIKKADRKAAIVFCGTKESDKALITKAKTLGGICYYRSVVDFKVGCFHKNYEFYLVSDNEDTNVSYAAELIAKNSDVKKDKITVNAFESSGVNIDIVESLTKNNINLRFIDKCALLCNQIIFTHPLYDIPKDQTEISVMIIGCGETGKRMLKTVVWCGQMDGYTLKIRAYDTGAKQIEGEFFGEAPELKSRAYDIKFVEADIKSADFEKSIKDSLDATYVFISTGDDGLNLETAVKLRGIFRRNTGRYDLQPKILTRVRDDFKTANIRKSPYLNDRNIVAFGNVTDLFREKMPFETKFERLSLGVHLAYCDMLGADTESSEFKASCDAFYSQEYNRRSSMATALHIASKLRSVGVLAPSEYELTNEVADCLEEAIKDNEELVLRLARNEHLRWNAFFKSEGYLGVDFKEVKKYVPTVGKHKDILSKTHPCITKWGNLDSLSEKYNALSGRNEDFKASDIKIIKAIPDIIRFANND